MKLTVVGCSGSIPGPESPSSCYLVEHDGFRVVLDLGSGALGALQRYLGLDDIDAILISHQHADHCIDLLPFMVSKKWNPTTSRDRTLVIGPSTLAERLTLAYDMPVGELDIHELLHLQQPSNSSLGPFGLTFARAQHPGEAWSMRLTAGGRSLVYSGDTGASQDLVKLADGADVALFEAGWRAGTEAGTGLHLSPSEAADHALRAGVGRLIVTHVPPWADRDASLAEARDVWGDSIEMASAGATFEV
jgi:ribonuclease BN (tRNA processing enzyme)